MCVCPSCVRAGAVQGKHFAATYALHTINWDKSMHRLMPPPYKVYWEELEVGRKDKFDVKLKKVTMATVDHLGCRLSVVGFWAISHAFLSSPPPLTRRGMRSG